MILSLAALGQQYTTNKQQFGDFFLDEALLPFSLQYYKLLFLEYDTIPIIIIDSDYS